MMLKPKPFDINKRFICSLKFISQGISFSKGDLYPWKKMGIPVRKLEMLHETGYIVNGEPKSPSKESDLLPEKFAPKTFLGLNIVEGDNGWFYLYTRTGEKVASVRAKDQYHLPESLEKKRSQIAQKIKKKTGIDVLSDL